MVSRVVEVGVNRCLELAKQPSGGGLRALFVQCFRMNDGVFSSDG